MISDSTLCLTFHLELLRHLEEAVEVGLGHADLPVVHEVQHTLHVPPGHAPQIQHHVRVSSASLENSFEEAAAGTEDHFVSLDVFVVAGDGDVQQVGLAPQLSEGGADVTLKIVPSQAEFFL